MNTGKKLLIGSEIKTSNKPHTYLLDIYRKGSLTCQETSTLRTRA